MSDSPFQDEEFGALLNDYVLKLRSIDDLQGHPKFHGHLRDACYSFDFKIFNGVYGPEDLYQDSHIKVRRSGHRLQVQGKLLCEEEFTSWLFVLVRNVIRSKDRQLNRLRRNGLRNCDEPIEELNEPAPAVNLDGKYFLSLFMEFIKDYPEDRQRAIKLWLSGCSLREIQRDLGRGGARLSYGTVRNERSACLRAFKEKLRLLLPEQKKKRSRRR